MKNSKTGQYTLNIMAPTRVFPMSLNHQELKSGTAPEKTMEKRPDCSSRLALTSNKRRAVLKNYTIKIPLVISLVCSDSVSLPMKMISLMMKRRRM